MIRKPDAVVEMKARPQFELWLLDHASLDDDSAPVLKIENVQVVAEWPFFLRSVLDLSDDGRVVDCRIVGQQKSFAQDNG